MVGILLNTEQRKAMFRRLKQMNKRDIIYDTPLELLRTPLEIRQISPDTFTGTSAPTCKKCDSLGTKICNNEFYCNEHIKI